MRYFLFVIVVVVSNFSMAQSYPPAAGEEGSTAIHMDSIIIHSWASKCTVTRGLQDISNSAGPLANAGTDEMALGKADGACVSLGDGGSAIITLEYPLKNENGFDFAIFENGFYDGMQAGYFLELATVEVSSNGTDYAIYPNHSEVQDSVQLGAFETIDPRYITGLAGKYQMQYGTPFDLSLVDSTIVDLNTVTHIRITDVIGNIDSNYATYDSFGNAINDPYPTAFPVGGFDLDAVAILKEWLINSNGNLEKPEFKIYPNPVQDFLYFSYAESVSIYNMQGQLLLCQKNVDRVDLTCLKSGVYVVGIEAMNELKVQRVIKE